MSDGWDGDLVDHPAYDGLSTQVPVRLEAPPPSRFPVDALPSWSSTFVDHLSVWLQVPADLVALAVLGNFSAALAGQLTVEALPGWSQPTCLWVAGIAEPGTRKSEVLKQTSAPLRAVEKALADEAVDTVAAYDMEVRRAQQSAAKLAQQADTALVAAGDPAAGPEAQEAAVAAMAAAAEAQASLERLVAARPVRPRLLMSDATPEAVAVALSEQGSLALMSDEATVWATVAGRYSSGGSAPPVEVFLQAYSGSPIVLDRRGIEGTRRVDEPALTMLVMAQPKALADMASNPGLSGRGFFDRWIIAKPADNRGTRDHATAAAEGKTGAPVRAHYAHCFTTMTTSVRNQGRTAAVFDDAARGELIGWMQAKEPELGPGGSLRSMAGVVSKRQGDIARIAALLHVAHAVSASGGLSNSWLEPVGQQRVRDAISIVEWSLDHAAAISTEEQLDPMTRKMLRCLSWLRRNVSPSLPVVAKRDLFNGVRAVDLAKVADLDPVLAELTALKWLAPHTPAGLRAGGRPREEYWVHPEVWV